MAPPTHQRRSSRPAVSLVVPFRGDSTAAVRLLTALSRLRVAAGDELILADNTEKCVAGGLAATACASLLQRRSAPPTTRETPAPARPRTAGSCSSMRTALPSPASLTP